MESSTTSSLLHPLVTQTLVQSSKFFCPFLERGFCRDSSRCNFSHDNIKAIKIPTDYCHFYLANQCLYGQDCKFRHSEPSRPPSSSAGLTINTPAQAASHHNLTPTINYQVNNLSASSSNSCSSASFAQENNTSSSEANSSPTSNNSESTGIGIISLLHFLNQNRSNHQNIRTQIERERSQHYNKSPVGSSVGGINEPSSSQQSKVTPSSSLSVTNATVIASTSSSSSATSYAKACKGSSTAEAEQQADEHDAQKELPLCPFASTSGECPYPNGQCTYLHGLDCDLCGRPCLHPYNLDQQLQHREDCLREHEREMELSFAIQRSKDKVCGICMDTVVEKTPITSSRFGILEKCNHIFCLDCIRKWRGTKQFETRTIRACPECRVSSDFVVPSKYWIEDQTDKDKLISDYKAALRAKPCKYFDEGKGDCPFAGSCFYKHAYPNGQLAAEEPPKPRRRLYGARGATSTVANYILWNIMASTDDDDWSNDELESLYYDPDLGTDDENSNDDWLDYR